MLTAADQYQNHVRGTDCRGVYCAVFLLLLLPALPACGGSTPNLTTPDQYRTNDIVVPEELQAVYDELLLDPDKFEWGRETQDIPLEFRRAHIYEVYNRLGPVPLDFKNEKGQYYHQRLYVLTFYGGEEAADRELAKTASAATGLRLADFGWVSGSGFSSFGLEADRPMLRGEEAWISDLLLVQGPDRIKLILPWFTAEAQ